MCWCTKASDGENATRAASSLRYIDSLRTSTAIADHVKVDFELRGCPIDKRQLLDVITAMLSHRKPDVRGHLVCIECKRAGLTCVMVAHGTPRFFEALLRGRQYTEPPDITIPPYGQGCFRRSPTVRRPGV